MAPSDAPSVSHRPSKSMIPSAFPSLSNAPSLSLDPSSSPIMKLPPKPQPTKAPTVPDKMAYFPSPIPSSSGAPSYSSKGKGRTKGDSKKTQSPSFSDAPSSADSNGGKAKKNSGSKNTKPPSTADVNDVVNAFISSPPSQSPISTNPGDSAGAGRAIVSSSSLLCHSVTSAISVFLVGTLVFW